MFDKITNIVSDSGEKGVIWKFAVKYSHLFRGYGHVLEMCGKNVIFDICLFLMRAYG